MDHKKIRVNIGRFLGWVGLNICSFIIRSMPERALYKASRYLANAAYFIAAKQRKIALESLTVAFGREKSVQEIDKIARECFVSMAKSGAELIFFMEKLPLLAKRVTIEGEENLTYALSRGHGVILITGHFGNFPLMLASLALSGYKACGIMRPMRDSRVEKMFLQKREFLKIRTIYSQPRKTCVEESLRALRNNELLMLPIDQNFGTGGVFINFFGVPAATATGPVILAQRTKAALLPSFIVRQPDDTHKIIFEPVIELGEGANGRETIINNLQKLTDVLELYIRRYPEQWGWIHRRWKSKPAGGV